VGRSGHFEATLSAHVGRLSRRTHSNPPGVEEILWLTS
jgi:hypothetical protein